jgi:hypothetical protein
MKPLRYFFLRCYEFAIRQRSPTPWLRPLVLLSALSGLNALVLIWICTEIWGGTMTISQRESISRAAIVLWTVLVFVTLYFRWIRSRRYLAFKEEFSAESNAQRKVRTALVLTYAIASLCGPAIVGYWVSLR